MFLVVGLIACIIIYVASFKNEFDKEDFDKSLPVLFVVGLIAIFMFILSNIA